MSRLPNKTIFLTGGASGIGLAVAELFLSLGSRVFILDSSAENIATATIHLSSLFPAPSDSNNPKFTLTQGDAADPDCLTRAIDKCVDVFGGLDVVVLNAGVLPKMKGILELKEEEWEGVMRVNAFGPFIGIQLSAQKMIALNELKLQTQHQPSPIPTTTPTTTTDSTPNPTANSTSPPPNIGTILLTCSASGLRSRPGVSAYTMSKFAVRGLTIAAAQELGKYGIRVNAVCPGVVDTPLLRGAGLGGGMVGREGVMQRFGTPEEVAKVFLFLASEDASFVTGSLYRVDGGLVDS
ncbi:NAD(P)-binding protein [Cadophora sp. DSE1049]|nr:NAD(P)-binding protein [Cadophora sp. DSE1049]